MSEQGLPTCGQRLLDFRHVCNDSEAHQKLGDLRSSLELDSLLHVIYKLLLLTVPHDCSKSLCLHQELVVNI